MLQFVFLVALFQIVVYLLMGHFKISWARYLVLILLVLANFVYFPGLFPPENSIEGVKCGLPVMAALMFFWLFGNTVSILTHLGYSLVKSLRK